MKTKLLECWNDFKVTLRTITFYTGIGTAIFLICFQIFGLSAVFKFPSVQQTCVFDELETPFLKKVSKTKGD